MLHDGHFGRGHVITSTLPVPETPGPGGLQAGRRSLVPVEQGGLLGLRNRYCAGDPNPGGGPWRRVSGFHLVGSDAALPLKVAAFFAPVCGRAVTGKNQIKCLNRSRQRAVWWSQACSFRIVSDCLPQFHLQNEGDHVVQTECQTRCAQCLARGSQEAVGKECMGGEVGGSRDRVRVTTASHTRPMQDMYNSGKGLQAQGGDSGHLWLAQKGWYPLIPIYPMDPKWNLSLLWNPSDLNQEFGGGMD